MKILLVTGHDYDSPRKTGFHFWADILSGRAVDVDFLTVGQSKLTRYIGNHKPFAPPHNQWVKKKAGLRKFVWMPLFHPLSLKNKTLDKIFVPFFSRIYPAMLPACFCEGIKDADVVIVEVGAGLLLVERLKKICPQARFVYTVSDRLSTLRAHPSVTAAEKTALSHFYRIRVPAEIMLEDYRGYPAVHIPQGIDKKIFDQDYDNPYQGPRNAVSVGDMLFDAHAVETMAERFPDWNFHVFGRNARIRKTLPNVTVYGERPFQEITPYIQHADIALAPYRFEESAAYLAQSSLKMFQYSYCRLPIVAPHFAAKGRPHVCGYNPANDDSVEAAFERATAYDRNTINGADVLDWNQVIDRMLSD